MFFHLPVLGNPFWNSGFLNSPQPNKQEPRSASGLLTRSSPHGKSGRGTQKETLEEVLRDLRLGVFYETVGMIQGEVPYCGWTQSISRHLKHGKPLFVGIYVGESSHSRASQLVRNRFHPSTVLPVPNVDPRSRILVDFD